MMSGRGLGHTGGTLDKLESIPGFRVGLSLEEFRAALHQVGCALIGQTREIAPADKVLYALRDVTATVESIPLITCSILSKKIAEGIDALVMDVKCGRGAFMKTAADARRLAETLVAIGNAQGVRTEALLTAMDVPLGRSVGNSLEVSECLEILRGEGTGDLEALSVRLAARMLLLGGVADTEEAAELKVREALSSGRGLEKFRQIVEQQGGDPAAIDEPRRLPVAPGRHSVRAARSGWVTGIDAELIGRAGMLLGAGRNRVEDTIDPGVGIVIHVQRGEQVRAGDALVELVHRDRRGLETAVGLVETAYEMGEAAPAPQPLILDTIR
jgi:pyrimidine-nucleoside phosphorylase